MDRTAIIGELQFIQQQEKLLIQRREYLLKQLSENESCEEAASEEEVFVDDYDPDPDPEASISDSGQPKLSFDDKARRISWQGGSIKFKDNGWRVYRFIRLVARSGANGITHAKVAQEIYGDELANINNLLQAARKRFEDSHFIGKIKNFGEKMWITYSQ